MTLEYASTEIEVIRKLQEIQKRYVLKIEGKLNEDKIMALTSWKYVIDMHVK